MSEAKGAGMGKPVIAIVTPVLNDWRSLAKLIRVVAEQQDLKDAAIRVVAVDDGSPDYAPPTSDLLSGPVEAIDVVRLKANQGHQRAIALGLAFVERRAKPDLVIVMDSDGEDRPEDISRLLEAHRAQPQAIVVAHRRRRSEGAAFRIFYQIYKSVFRLLTGRQISFGNFSLVPIARLPNVLYNEGVWNSYAATLLRSRIPLAFVDTDRGSRYFGSSTMNFTSLMVHGMSAIAAFSDVVIGRIVAALSVAVALFVAAVIAIAVVRVAAGVFIPGYATTVVLFLTNMLVNALLLGFLMILTLLATRTQKSALPSAILDDLLLGVDSVARTRAAA